MISNEILAQLNTDGDELVRLLDADVHQIFSTMLGIELSPSRRAETVSKFRDCVTAMVGFAGSYTGMVSINAPQKTAMGFASEMLGMEISECDDDTRDALGEIANMIGGSFKHHFVRDGHEVRLSTPSVMSGDEYVMSVGSVPDTLTLVFDCGGKEFLVTVYLEPGE
jgi:chemotaxis protein CheX